MNDEGAGLAEQAGRQADRQTDTLQGKRRSKRRRRRKSEKGRRRKKKEVEEE